MRLRRAATLLLVVAACRPAVRGRCASDTDCRAGSSCSPDGLCVFLPAPSIQVVIDAAQTLSPASPRVLVRVTANSQHRLGRLSVAVGANGTLASGALAAAAPGDNLVTLSGFDPAAVGQAPVTATLAYTPPGGAAQTVTSDPAIAAIDAQPPAVHVFLPDAADTVNGWVPRAGPDLAVQAQVDDGAGTGPASATLTLDHCPPSSPCIYPGTLVARPSAGAATFSFAVPRAVQAPGSEAPVAGVVTALDQAQNAGRRPVTLQIDDAPPALGAVTLVSGGVAGEDGHQWFIGGANAAPVEVAITASDRGAGLLDVALHLDPSDVSAGTADPVAVPAPDGSLHFRLPASAVVGREGAVRFSISAHDGVHNGALVPESPATSVWIDDRPPQVTVASVDYTSTQPPSAEVCAAGVTCGRGPAAAPDHLLRDDVATVTFDAFDCGAGLGATGAAINGVAATQAGTSGAPCAGSTNAVHRYTVQLDLSTQTPGAPDLTGSETLALSDDAADLLGHHAGNTHGAALISIVRWRAQPLNGALPVGSPALLPGSGLRQIVLGMSGSGTPNLFVLNPQGGTDLAATVARISSDVAVDKQGVVYAVGYDSSSGPSKLSMFDTANPNAAFGACDVSDATIGTPPVIAGFADSPLAVLASTSTNGLHDVYVFRKGTCTPFDSELLTLGTNTTFSGAAAKDNTLYFGHSNGFTSIAFDPSARSFVAGTEASFSVSSGPTPGARGGPSVGLSPESPYFAGSDRKVHKSASNTCTGTSCWTPLVTTPAAAAILNGTPVFDTTAIYDTDSNGVVYAWAQAGGSTPLGTVSPTTGSTAILVSSPVLVGSLQAVVVQHDATVRLLSFANSSGGTTLLQMTRGGAAASYASGVVPPTPVVDARGSGGVAYIPDGAGWVWAVQLDQPPVAASAQVWPRPGRDSCNSRNASASYCP